MQSNLERQVDRSHLDSEISLTHLAIEQLHIFARITLPIGSRRQRTAAANEISANAALF